MKNSKRYQLVSVAVAVSMALTGCTQNSGAGDAASTSTVASSPSKPATSSVQSTKRASLADWDGAYVSLAAFVDDPSYEAEFADAAKEHNVDLEHTKAELKQRYGVPFEGLKVDGDTLTLVKEKTQLDSPMERPVNYTFDESFVQQFKGHDLKWSIFKNSEGGEYKYVMLMPMHGEESLQHFHARFGDDKEALKKEETFPTFVDPKIATKEQIVDELMEHAH